MSNKCLNYVIENSEARGSARLVLIMLADMSNDDGECFPGKASLAHKCRMSNRSVRLALKKLEITGEIGIFNRRAGRFNRSNLYKIYIGGGDQGSSGVVIRDHQGGDHRSLGVMISDHQGGDQGSPDPLRIPNLESLDDPELPSTRETPMQKAMREDRERWQ